MPKALAESTSTQRYIFSRFLNPYPEPPNTRTVKDEVCRTHSRAAQIDSTESIDDAQRVIQQTVTQQTGKTPNFLHLCKI
ncbi:MAG: hypothetical protein HC827_14350 [Cyanobacteria bacterium RM1_2_2]|nr:hypothetical protein [Cyanobacteria bacterium RM1_2_2]